MTPAFRVSRFEQGSEPEGEPRAGLRTGLRMPNAVGSASRVNRTHRVVRERAKTIEARRRRVRGLYVPLAICSALLVAVYFAVWSLLAQYEQTPNGAPGASNQMMVLLLWSVPISAALLAVVWYRQAKTTADGGSAE